VYLEVEGDLEVAGDVFSGGEVHNCHPHIDYVDRHQTIYYVELINEIRQQFIDDYGEEDEWCDEDKEDLEFSLNLAKEKILQSGKQGCVYEW
jgi:hypothetical protein